MKDCTIRVAKTKAVISCAVNAQLICAFDFAYADVVEGGEGVCHCIASI